MIRLKTIKTLLCNISFRLIKNGVETIANRARSRLYTNYPRSILLLSRRINLPSFLFLCFGGLATQAMIGYEDI